MALYPLRESICLTAPGMAWHYLATRQPKNPWAVATIVFKLARSLRRTAPDVVFTAMPAANAAAAVAGAIVGAARRIVLSHHSPVETHSPRLNAVDSLTGSLGSVKAVISVSRAVERSLDAKPARYRAKRITVHNAVPPRIETLLATLSAAQTPRVMRRRRIVATGRLAAQKNYPLLIRAARLLTNVTIDIVGSGPDEDALRALAEALCVTDRVRFLGHRPREEALAICASGDVFVQVSLFEGHSLGLIEAAKLGLPLVVSDVPSQIEGITARDGSLCGLVCGVDDAHGLARQLDALLDEPALYAEFAARALRLGAEATFADLLDAYEALAE
jgi:glycosyltransferase involved in cell wall biosynthesis